MKHKINSRFSRRIEWMSVRDIGIEASAQRPFDARHAENIAKALDPDKLGYPLVAEVGTPGRTRFIAVDGQHRIAAVRSCYGEDEQIQCEVVRGLTVNQAAELFLGRSYNKSIHTLNRFRIAVTAGRPDETAINDAVERLGLRVQTGTGDGTLSAVNTLLALRKLDAHRDDPHDSVVTRVLRIALAAWGRKATMFQGDVLRGLGLVLLRYGTDIDEARLVSRLAGVASGALGVLSRGRSFRETTGGSVFQGCARAIVALYNVGLRSNGLAEWNDRADRRGKTARTREAA